MNAVQLNWPLPPAHFTLQPNEVHVWGIGLTQPETSVQKLATMLAEEERERAAHFQFEHLRQRFLVGHGALRHILSRYTGCAAENLRFVYGPFGKPALAFEGDLHFNLSHSEDLALVAVTRGSEIGIDVERFRLVTECDRIAQTNFSPREYETFCALEHYEKLAAFFRCWTRKEAFIKALGLGLNMPLDQFEVAFAPGEAARLLRIHHVDAAAARWSLLALHPAPGYTAALAVEKTEFKPSFWQWA